MSKNKAKGTRYESALVAYLNSEGLTTYRPAQAGARDTGDIHGIPHFAVQAKDWRDVTGAVREGTDGVQKQRENLGAQFGVNFVKRAHKPIAHGYAVMRIDNFIDLLRLALPWAFKDGDNETE